MARLEHLNQIFNTPEKRANSIQSIDMIENVMKLEIDKNKDKYYDSSGNLNIEKVFNACGISLNSCTPQ